MATNIGDISDCGLPHAISGLGQTKTGRVFDDGAGTVTVLKQGTIAPRQVRQMQQLLNQFGYNLTADGVFGPGTNAAVKAVQAKLSMAVTGIYDKALDERIVGMNQSGIIDAKPADKQLVALGEKTPTITGGLLPPPKQGTGMSITPVKDINGQPVKVDVTGGAMTPGMSFIDKVKAKWTVLKADPNFKYYAAGAGVVVAVGGLMLIGGTKNPAQPQMNGYWPSPTRKSRKSRKSRR